MASTVVTAGLGYVFWVFAAHAFTSQEVGIGSAVISLCSTAALLTYLGSSAILIERLPASEHSSEWTAILVRVCLVTAGVTAVATAVAVPVLLSSQDYRLFFSTMPPDTPRSGRCRGMDPGQPSRRGVHRSPPRGSAAIDPGPGQRGQGALRSPARGRRGRRDGHSWSMGCECRTRRRRRSRLARTSDGPRPPTWPSPASTSDRYG